MKKNLHFNFLLIFFLIGLCFNAAAQREVVIEGYPMTGDITKYVDAITKALAADAPNRVTDPNVVYVLKRGQIYPNATTLKNTFKLRMKASSGTGALPAIIQWANSQGKYSSHLEAQADVYFENIQFEQGQADGSVKVRSIQLNANKIRGVFKGCVFYQDGGGAICPWADSTKVYVYDCFAHSIGRKGENNSNGRFVDTRMTNYCDTVIIQNCTADHLNGAFFRGGSAITGYLKIDHCTTFNNRDAAINAFRPKKAIITNNLFVNSQLLGSVPSMNDPLDTNPDHYHNVTIDFDTIRNKSDIVIRNNNVVNTKEVKDMWAKYDTIFEPLRVDPLAMRMLGADSVNAAFSEVVTFKSICAAPLPFIEAIIKNRTLTIYPDQLCLGTNGGLFPDQVNASYPTTTKSYTAADGGYPVGDLNWFPDKKALWQKDQSTAVVNLISEKIEVYPNPATDKLYIITGNLDKANISIYDILGKQVFNTISNGGNTEIDLSAFEKGMYIYRISDARYNLAKAGKLLIVK